MRKLSLSLVFLLCMAMLFGCAGQAMPTTSALPAGTVTAITRWPENEYTRSIPEPATGTPDYVIHDKTRGSYSIFFKDISRQQSLQYIETLKESGFNGRFSDANEFSAGYLLQKDDISLGISFGENVLGIYITQTSSNA